MPAMPRLPIRFALAASLSTLLALSACGGDDVAAVARTVEEDKLRALAAAAGPFSALFDACLARAATHRGEPAAARASAASV